VFHPTHVNRQTRLFDEATELAGRGVTVDVTAFPVQDGDPGLSAADAILRWIELGLPRERLTCSSDGGGCLPVFDAEGRVTSMDVGRSSALAATLATLLKRGLTAQDALPFFTSHVASVLRLAAKGRVRVGGDADLVVLGPGAEVRDVMARGKWLVRNGVPVVRGPFEPNSVR
jgi:beta-aspartyl-dipeptidase (metallo-type)